MATSRAKTRPGTLRERSPGHWQLRAFAGADPVTGKPTQVARTFVGTERAASKALAALVTEVEAGIFAPTSATVSQLLDQWLEVGENTQRPRTLYENRRKIEARIRPKLGAVKLSKLDAAMLDKTYRDWLAEGLSPATVHKYHTVLSAALRQAVKWGYIGSAPTARATPPKVERHEMKVPTPEQLSALVKAADAVDPVLATAVALAALTGARRGELVALKWSDIDLGAGRVKIARSLTVARGEQHTGPTKTHQSRDLALDSVCLEVLRSRWDFMVELPAEAASPLVPDPYVLSYNGSHLPGDRCGRTWQIEWKLRPRNAIMVLAESRERDDYATSEARRDIDCRRSCWRCSCCGDVHRLGGGSSNHEHHLLRLPVNCQRHAHEGGHDGAFLQGGNHRY